MKAETLKKAILQYAMQGKLVEQNPNDEPASELLKRIKAEKEELIKQGKIKKEKPLPPITQDEIPFELPKGWECCRISDLYDFKTGISYKKELLDIKSNKMVRILRGGNINNLQYVLKSDDIFIASEYVKDELLLKENYLITPAVTSLEHIGKFAYIDENYTDTIVGGFVLMFVPCSSNILSKFFLYIFSSPYVREYMRDTTNKSGQAFYNISKEKLKELCIPIPPLAEQQRIVDKLEEILPLIEEYGKNEEELEKLNKTLPDKIKQSILQHAVQGKLVPQNPNDEPASELLKRIQAEKEELIKQGKIKKEKSLPPITEDEKPFIIPDSWTWCRVSDIGIYKKGPFGSALTKKIFVPRGNNTIKVYEQKNAIQKDATLGNYYISKEYYEKSMKNFKVSAGDVIVSCAGTIGETYVMPDNIELGIINQALMRMTITKDINLKYFLIYFDIILKKDSKTYSKGSAIKNIPPFDIFKKMLIPLPPLAEQQRIVDKVEELMKIVDKIKN